MILTAIIITFGVFLANNHGFAGMLVGNGIALSLINPAFSSVSVLGLAEEIYCNTNTCDANSNLVKEFITDKANITYPKEFIEPIGVAFVASSALLLGAKYILPTILAPHAKVYLDNPLSMAAIGLVLPNIVTEFFGTDHCFAGINFGLSLPLTMVDLKYALLPTTAIAREAYCHLNECDSKTNIVAKVLDLTPISLDFLSKSTSSYMISTAALASVKYVFLRSNEGYQGHLGAAAITLLPALYLYSSLAVLFNNFDSQTGVVAGVSMALAQVETDSTIGIKGAMIASGADLLYHSMSGGFIAYGISGAVVSSASLYIVKHIALESPKYDVYKSLAGAAALVPGIIIAAMGDDNHEMIGAITGASIAAITNSPEFGYTGLVCAALGEVYLSYNDTLDS